MFNASLDVSAVTRATGAIALTRLLAAMLFEVSSTDVTTYIVACGVLALAALIASIVPARRALNVDPIAMSDVRVVETRIRLVNPEKPSRNWMAAISFSGRGGALFIACTFIAAMWSGASILVTESSRYHPEITVAAPHDILFLPHRNLHYPIDVGLSGSMGTGVLMRKTWYG